MQSVDARFSTAAVVGVGRMGTEIARAFAEAGLTVKLVDTDPQAVSRAKEQIRQSLNRRMDLPSIENIMSRLVEARLDDLGDVDFIQESIPEDLERKGSLFEQLDAVVPPGVALATNTSSISVSDLAARCRHGKRVVGVHWVSPAYLIPVVEVIYHSDTDPDVLRNVSELLRQVGKRPVISRDIPGFLVNRLQFALLNEALYLLHHGYATKEDIDTAVRFAIAPRWALWGPLRSQDLKSNKRTMLSSTAYIYQRTGDPRFRPPEALEELVAQNRLGFESGKGFYSYEGMDPRAVAEHRDRAIEGILIYLQEHSDDEFWSRSRCDM